MTWASELDKATLRVEEILGAGAAHAYGFHGEARECCSCGHVTDYGCAVPVPPLLLWACSDCNARPECWPYGDDGDFVPLSESGAA